MLDPIPAPPPFFTKLVTPIADALSLPTLPLHAHEIILAFTIYHLVNTRISPRLSALLFPRIYPALPARTKINWDVHVVSLFQSCVINILALWVMYADQERKQMAWRGRIWGYTGAGGMIQGFAAGYFVWDLMVTIANVHAFGWGMLAHAVSALIVFSLGFVSIFSSPELSNLPQLTLERTHQRPFVNYYGPTFILYELSSPFLNFHWFFDKINMTGSRAQLYNGILLLVTFFLCRLVWGTYQSVRVYQDVWAALQAPGPGKAPVLGAADPTSEIMRFAGDQHVPVWLAITYLGSNLVLNTLNFYWFGKMIETVRKRFRPKKTSNHRGSAQVSGMATGKQILEMDDTEVRWRH